jgi:aspartate-semialdehyde dehydrogenase
MVSVSHYQGRKINLAIIGATGAVGTEMLSCLAKRHFPVGILRLFSSAKSVGQTVRFLNQTLMVEELREDTDLTGIDIALFAAGSAISRHYAPIMAQKGIIVIDNSSAFRMNHDVPLVVPEVNPQALGHHHNIIANPNCSTIIATLPIKAIDGINPVKRVIASTYQAASGAGAAGMQELLDSTVAYLEHHKFSPKIFPHPYGFNLFSHNTAIDEQGYNEEEMKMTHETRKILAKPDFRISATCIRVPVLRTHCESLNIECEHEVDLLQIVDALKHFPGIKVVDNRKDNVFPMPNITSEQDNILVGRIRYDITDSSHKTFWLWISGDQLLKGAALNAVQIAEKLTFDLQQFS